MLRSALGAFGGAAVILAVAAWFVVWLIPSAAHGAECQMVRASWYGIESCAKPRDCRTASGMRFTGREMIVAHRSLPFGTRLRLTYKGRSVVVTVEDRGPWIAGRALDLSEAVARKLETKGIGVADVCMAII